MGLSLTCTVREMTQGFTNMPSAVWMTESGPVTVMPGVIFLTQTIRNDTTAITTLSFSPLHTSHAGLYTCQGKLASLAASGNITVTSKEPLPVVVSCK